VNGVSKTIAHIVVLAAIILLVHLLYALWILPEVSVLQVIAKDTGDLLPRNFFVIVKDLEQEICIILFLWGLYLMGEKFYETSSQAYLFDVDLLKDIQGDDVDANSTLASLEALPKDIKNAPLVRTIASALRRYIITGSVQNASESISPALEAMMVKSEAELAVVKYVAWAIPSIGFLGTVRGIGMAMSDAKTAVAGNIGPMTESLGTAFNSTFVALLASVVIMLLLSFLQRSQDEQLVQVQEYCEKYLIERISVTKQSSF
jgi:biopolymer transport protein ExbB/TolQ